MNKLPELHPYQARAIDEAIELGSRYEAIDMGLGKTRIMLEYLQRTNSKALVIGPYHVVRYTWPEEIQKWTPQLNYVLLHGPRKTGLFRLSDNVNIRLLNYDGLKWLYTTMSKYGSHGLRDCVLILDESTFIKRPSSVRFKALKAILHLFKAVYPLTGTPLSKNYKDLWSQYYTIDKGEALGRTFTFFRQEHFYESGPPRWLCELKEGHDTIITNSVAHMTTVLRSEDYLSLPEKTTSTIVIDLPPGAMDIYKEFKQEFIYQVGDKATDIISAINSGVQTNKLRQIIQGAVYYDDRGARCIKDIHDAKLSALEEFLSTIDGDPVLCPIFFKFELEHIRKRMGYNVPAIVGGVPDKEKDRIKSAWNEGKVPLLLAHPKSVGHGLNLQSGGRYIYWYHLTWDMELYNQLNKRLHRQGQTRPVHVIHCCARNTIDERVARSLENKLTTLETFKQNITDYFLSKDS